MRGLPQGVCIMTPSGYKISMTETNNLSPEQTWKANLIQVLMEDVEAAEESLEEPPDTAVDWSEAQIRSYFTRVTPDTTAGTVHKGSRRFTPPQQNDLDMWFPCMHRSSLTMSTPRLRALCFHNAGSAADMFTSEGTGTRQGASPLLDWCRNNGAECLAVQLPGRGMRSKEPFLTSLQEAAQQLLPIVACRLENTPYIVVAHSMGAWFAYEFLCHARASGLPLPHKVFLSAMPHPALPLHQRPWKQQLSLDEAEFQEECKQWDVNPVLFSPALWPAYHRIMRADFHLFDQYQNTHEGDAPFDFPLTTFYGSKDRRVTEEMVRGWQTFTTGQFTCTAIDGNHLWPLDKHAKMIWLRHIVDELHANKFIAPAG